MGTKATTTNFLFCPSFKYFFCLPHTQYAAKIQNHRNQGSIAKKIRFFLQSLRHIPRWVRLVQKTRSKNSHAWAPLKEDDRINMAGVTVIETALVGVLMFGFVCWEYFRMGFLWLALLWLEYLWNTWLEYL